MREGYSSELYSAEPSMSVVGLSASERPLFGVGGLDGIGAHES